MKRSLIFRYALGFSVLLIAAMDVSGYDIQTNTYYYTSGRIREQYEYYYSGGIVRHGWYKRWFDLEGSPQHYGGNYYEGLMQDLWSYWYTNGVLSAETWYDAGQKHGSDTRWYDDGRIQFIDYYDHDVLTSGVNYVYYTNNVLCCLYEHDGDNLIQGLYTRWDEQGRLTQRIEYVDGQYHGLYEEWSRIADGTVTYYYRKHYAAGVLHGDSETYQNGVRTQFTPYCHGKWHGTLLYWDPLTGALTWERPYYHGLRHGLQRQWISGYNGGTWQLGEARYGVNHGVYVGTDYNLWVEGQYSNGKRCGVWRRYLQLTGEYIGDTDYGPCEPFEIPPTADTGYPPIEEPAGGGEPDKQLRGHVSRSDNGDPIYGATVAIGSDTTTTGTDGFYSLDLPGVSNATVACSLDGYHSVSNEVDFEGVQYKTINFTLRATQEEEQQNKTPVVTDVESGLGHVFLSGLAVTNPYTASLDWNGSTSSVVRFDLNGTPMDEPASDDTAMHVYNMGTDFIASVNTRGNTLSVTALSSNGSVSEAFTLNPIVLPVPHWALLLAPFNVTYETKGKSEVVKYSWEKDWPEDPVEIRITEETLGSTLWQAWSLFPFVGGRNLGLPPSQAGVEVELNTDGEGSVQVKGKTGFQVAGGEIGVGIGGKGEARYVPGDGLAWKGAAFVFGIEGTVTKDAGPITIIPALESAASWPVVGRPIGWFNDRAKVIGTFTVGGQIELQIMDESGELGFGEASGELSESLGLALKCELTDSMKATMTGQGTIKILWQAPANPGYLKGLEAELQAGLELEIWSWQKSFTVSHVFEYPESEASSSVMFIPTGSEEGFVPMSRKYLSRGGERFVAGEKLATLALPAVGGTTATRLIENVFPRARPALAVRNDRVAIACVASDPADPVLQSTEINFLRYDGSWSSPAWIENDTRGEFSPAVAFDSSNNVVCAWERVSDPGFSETNDLAAMAAEMEIVYACYDWGTATWSSPVPLSTNTWLDYSPMMAAGPEGEILLCWLSNTNNELIGTATHPSSLHYAFWEPSAKAFGASAVHPDPLADCFDFSAAYDGTNAVVAYARDMDGVFFDTNAVSGADQEIFYTKFEDGSWKSAVQLTSDNGANVNPRLVAQSGGQTDLLWLKGTNVVMLTDWDIGAWSVARPGSVSVTLADFSVYCDPTDNLVMLWQDAQDGTADLHYSVYDRGAGLWSADRCLTQDAPVESDISGGFSSNGVLHVAYSLFDAAATNTDLYHLSYELGRDVRVDDSDLSIRPALASPGSNTTLRCLVHNDGDFAVTGVDVAFTLGDPDSGGIAIGTDAIVPSMISAGSTGTAEVAWIVPDTDTYRVYARVDPLDGLTEQNETNNTASFEAVRSDLEALLCKLELHSNGSADIITTIKNNGPLTVTNVAVLYRVGGEDVGTLRIPGLLAGLEADVTHTIGADVEFATESPRVEFEIDPWNEIGESNESNNVAFTALTYETDTDGDGLPDALESEVFGGLWRDGNSNLDGDIMTDGEELIAGTNPTNSNDIFVIQGMTTDTGTGWNTMNWISVLDRLYTVHSTTNLMDQTWTPEEQWTGTGGIMQYTIPSDDPAKFFSLEVALPDTP